MKLTQQLKNKNEEKQYLIKCTCLWRDHSIRMYNFLFDQSLCNYTEINIYIHDMVLDIHQNPKLFESMENHNFSGR